MSARRSKPPQSAGRPHRKSLPRGSRAVGSPGSRALDTTTIIDWRLWLLFPALLVVTLAVYQPAWHGGVLWDDDANITHVELRSLEGLQRIWFHIGATQQYYPVVHSVFWLQHRLWGDQTLGYHLLNIVLHTLSALLIAVILRRLKAPGALLAAAIFALHPVHVESVAWMTELKNTLSTVFYLASALVYLHFDESRRIRTYVLALLLFALAVLSKTVAATLAPALLVVFWWQRGRIDWRQDVLPLMPFVAIGVAGGLTTAWVERTLVGAEGADFQFTLVERCLIAGRAIWFYLAKLVWPANLVFIYPRWAVSQTVSWQYVYPIGAVVLVVALWSVRSWSRAPLAAFLFFAGTLFPALGFFNVYAFNYSFVADHFQYLASIGIIALMAGGLSTLTARLASLASLTSGKVGTESLSMAGLMVVAVCGPLGVLTWNQSHQYADVETLYRTTLSRNPSCWLAENNLGELEMRRSPAGVLEATGHFKTAIALSPDYAVAHNNLGAIWQRMGKLDEALAEFRLAARLQPRYADARRNLGMVLLQAGRPEEAVVELTGALSVAPNHAPTHFMLANALMSLRRPQDAVPHYQEAVRLRPDYVEAHNNLAGALLETGRPEEAVTHLRETLRLDPTSLNARMNLDRVLASLQKAPIR